MKKLSSCNLKLLETSTVFLERSQQQAELQCVSFLSAVEIDDGIYHISTCKGIEYYFVLLSTSTLQQQQRAKNMTDYLEQYAVRTRYTGKMYYDDNQL